MTPADPPQNSPPRGEDAGPRIPPGYERLDEAARRAGVNPVALKRRLRKDPDAASALGAWKIPWRGAPGLWILPANTPIPKTPEGRPAKALGRVLSDAERDEIARRAGARENHAALAREFGVHRSYVGKLKERLRRKAEKENETEG